MLSLVEDRRTLGGPALDEDVARVLAACRVLVGVSVQSLDAVADRVNIVQLRILVVLASRAGATLGDVAVATGMHVSRASRTCERMVDLGLIRRSDHPYDGRRVHLTVTRRGQLIVDKVTRARHAAIEPALRQMGHQARVALAAALEKFAGAAGEPAEASLWSVGWVT